jgi:heme/copper-type cytochrome/quinol oxidase subunit 3
MSTHTTNHHVEHPDVVGSRNRLGVILILVADIAFALSVLFVYFYLKGQNVNDMWLPKATEDTAAVLPLSSSGAWIVTALAGVGLLSHGSALRAAKAKQNSQLVLGSIVALVLSIGAIAYQLNLIFSVNFVMGMGSYYSCYMLIAWLNVVHLALTVFIALGNWNRARLNLYAKDHWQVAIVNVWWIWMFVSSGLGAFALTFT